MPTEVNQRQPLNFTIYIVESPSPSDLYDGTSEGELLAKSLSLAQIKSKHRLVINTDTIWKFFTTELLQHFVTFQSIPILHISAHGDERGVNLSSGEIMNWSNLGNILEIINRAFNGRLIVCMSSCNGFSAWEMAMNTKFEYPFLILIGPKGKPTWSETAVGFTTFYHLLAKQYNVPDAVKAMNSAAGTDFFTWISGEEAKKIYFEKLNAIKLRALRNRADREIAALKSST